MVGSIIAAQLEDHGELRKGSAFVVLVFICINNSGFSRWVFSSERDFSSGDTISPVKYQRGGDLSLHFRCWSNSCCNALQLQGWDFFLFRWMGGGDDRIHSPVFAGD